MTIVLYFGTDHHWYGKKNIKGLMKIPEGLEEYINDCLLYTSMGFETPQAVYKWLSGKSLPSLDNFVILSRLLNTSIEDIPVSYTHLNRISRIDGTATITNPITIQTELVKGCLLYTSSERISFISSRILIIHYYFQAITGVVVLF